MKTAANSKTKETWIYAAIWALLFASPLISAYIQWTGHETTESFPWHDIGFTWQKMLFFFTAFLLHNYLLAPLLVYRHKTVLYLSGFAILLALFITIQCTQRPEEPSRHHMMHQQDGHRPPDEPQPFDDKPPVRPHEMEGTHRPPAIMGEHDIVATIVFLLMAGMNLGVKFYFRHRHDRERLAALQRQNLEQQLEYLKYQINPHFLMNTLNNIHALVDIDPEQAKETIVELSKIMRFVLYEGSKQTVPLRQEIIFLDNYIQLMRLRVAEQVDITVDIPQVVPDREIPPLMLITFVENAFKHGVSYQQHSFISISITLSDDRLLFHCSNSKVPAAEDRHGGVGLQNVKRRLELIYGKDHTLDIHDETDTYTVDLAISLSPVPPQLSPQTSKPSSP